MDDRYHSIATDGQLTFSKLTINRKKSYNHSCLLICYPVNPFEFFHAIYNHILCKKGYVLIIILIIILINIIK